MTPYVSVSKFKLMGTGADLTDITDSTLAAMLSAATSRVNRYCAVPKTPVPHDFRGGTVGEGSNWEKHQWDVGSMYRQGSDRVYPFHYPVKAIQTFQLRVTVTQTVDFNPVDIYINNDERYLEVISLAVRLSVFSAGYVPTIGLRVPVAELGYTYGYSFPVSGEAMTLDATTSGLYHADNQWWDTTEAITVYQDGVATASGLYTADADEGTVLFTTPPATTTAVTLDYTYRLPTEIAQATALIAADNVTRYTLQNAGSIGVAGIRIEETDVTFQDQIGGSPGQGSSRRPPSPIFSDTVSGPAAELLSSYVFRSWG